jgi:hypothetical protein
MRRNEHSGNRRNVQTCKRCGDEFDLEYRRGRPREHCYSCQPPGTRMIGAVKLMNESPPDLRPALAYLKAVASEDQEAIRVLTEPEGTPAVGA